MKAIRVGATVLFCLAFLVSCESPLTKMGDTAEKAADNSGKAADAASASREEIAKSRLMARSKSASESRRDALNAMMEMEGFPMKATEAAKFMKALEFQLWTGQKYDDDANLDKMLEEAVKEFFRSTNEINGDRDIHRTEISPFFVMGGASDKAFNVYAFAAALHEQHTFQDNVIAEKQHRPESKSMLDVLRHGLRAVQRVEDGNAEYGDLKDWQKDLYRYRNEALAIMQARLNIMLTMTLKEVSNIDKKGKISALKQLYIDKNFKSHFSKLNTGVRREVNVYLEQAVKTKNFLGTIGVESEIHPKIYNMFKKMNINKSDDVPELDRHLAYLDTLFPEDNMKFKRD